MMRGAKSNTCANVPSQSHSCQIRGRLQEGAESYAKAVRSNNTNNAIVRNRNDVEKMLDLIIAYYQKEEPSSPMPFLLRRAKGLVNKDFIEIISELSPGGANEAKSICGIIDE